MSWLRSRIQSFGYALKGINLLLHEPNFQIHLVAVILVTFSGFYFGINRTEWLLILLCFTTVMGTEAINTALEKTIDHLHPEKHMSMGHAKDMAAAAVLICAIFSAVIGLMIFLPYLGFDFG